MKGPGIVLVALLAGGGLGYLVWAGRGGPAPEPATSRARDVPAAQAAGAVAGPAKPFPDAGVVSQPVAEASPPAPGVDARDAETIQAETLEKIQELTVTYDAKSLPALAAYLRHADETVRAAAREGVVQLGEAEGARYLREAADRTKDPAEALALLDAAEFLELPPVNAMTPEFIARQAAKRARVDKKAPAP